MFNRPQISDTDEQALSQLAQSILADVSTRRACFLLLHNFDTYLIPFDSTSPQNSAFLTGRSSIGKQFEEFLCERRPNLFLKMLEEALEQQKRDKENAKDWD